MPIYAPTTGEILARRQYLASLRGAPVAVHNAPLSVNEALNIGQAGLMLAEPIAGGIAAHLRRGREEEVLAQQAQQRAAQNEAAIAPERAALDNARARSVQMLAQREMQAGGDNGYGNAIPDTTGAFQRMMPGQNADALAQWKSALGVQVPDTATQAFGDQQTPLQQIAERRIAPKPVPQMAPVEHVAPVPDQPLTAQPTQGLQPTEIGRRFTDTMPQQAAPMGLEALRAEAHKAGMSNDPEHKKRVLDQLMALGDAAYSPQGWHEIFNPDLARKRVLDEFHAALNPGQHGMNPLEAQYKLAQIADAESRRASREASMADKAATLGGRVAALDARVAESLARGPKIEAEAELAKIKAHYGADSEEAKIAQNLTKSNLNVSTAHLNDVRAEMEPRVTAAREKGANAQMISANANASRSNSYAKLVGSGGAGGPRNDLPPAVEAIAKELSDSKSELDAARKAAELAKQMTVPAEVEFDNASKAAAAKARKEKQQAMHAAEKAKAKHESKIKELRKRWLLNNRTLEEWDSLLKEE